MTRLVGDLSDHCATPPTFLIHDRDSEFGRAFDEIFRSVGTAPLAKIQRLDLLGGLLHEYAVAA